MARIYSEIQPELVVERLEAGRIHPIDPAPPYDDEAARRSMRIVAVMGAEPFQAALDEGADVVLCRPGHRHRHLRRHPAGPWLRSRASPGMPARSPSAAAGSAEPRRRLDVLHVQLEKDSFVVQPLADDLRCTPFSVAAHQLHEVADPFTLVEPGWITDMTQRPRTRRRRTARCGSAAAWPCRRPTR